MGALELLFWVLGRAMWIASAGFGDLHNRGGHWANDISDIGGGIIDHHLRTNGPSR